MKTMALSFLISIMGSVVLAGIDTSIPPENQIILKGDWTPTPEQTAKALTAIQTFLEHPKGLSAGQQAEIKKILANSSRYRVQFKGVLEKNRKIIRFNFFRAGGGRDEFPYWKKQQVIVDDGGFWFWQIDYDVQQGECLSFSSNGYA
jgi:hypothetical protein